MAQDMQIRKIQRLGKRVVGFTLFYNTLITAGFLFAFPLMIPLVVTSNKRRRTFLKRLGWHGYHWQTMHPKKNQASVWIHALSVGEVSAAQPLIAEIQNRHPGLHLVLTVSTFSGYQAASRLFAGETIDLAYFPYDWICSVRAVANKIKAQAVILVETDIWPNFLVEMKRRQVSVYMVNMRISESAWNGYRRFKWLAGRLFGTFEKIFVQTDLDTQRLIRLGVSQERLIVTGNIKFDGVAMTVSGSTAVRWREKLQLAATRKIIVAGSTHEGEERFLLDAYASIQKQDNAAGLILAPRDPQRTQEILTLCGHSGMAAISLTQFLEDRPKAFPDVIVIDGIGVLKDLFSIADVAFVGGTLVPEGGHNPLEPAVHGKPVVFGPDMRDFRQIAAWLLESGGAIQLADHHELATAFSQLLNNPQLAAAMGKQARQVVLAHQGAVSKTLKSVNLAFPIHKTDNGLDNRSTFQRL